MARKVATGARSSRPSASAWPPSCMHTRRPAGLRVCAPAAPTDIASPVEAELLRLWRMAPLGTQEPILALLRVAAKV